MIDTSPYHGSDHHIPDLDHRQSRRRMLRWQAADANQLAVMLVSLGYVVYPASVPLSASTIYIQPRCPQSTGCH